MLHQPTKEKLLTILEFKICFPCLLEFYISIKKYSSHYNLKICLDRELENVHRRRLRTLKLFCSDFDWNSLQSFVCSLAMLLAKSVRFFNARKYPVSWNPAKYCSIYEADSFYWLSDLCLSHWVLILVLLKDSNLLFIMDVSIHFISSSMNHIPPWVKCFCVSISKSLRLL